MDELAQLVEAHQFHLVRLGDRVFTAEKYVGRGRIRMITVRWNEAQHGWTGKLQTLELRGVGTQADGSAAPEYWRPRDAHPGVSVLWDFAGASDWLAKVERSSAQ